LALLAEVLGTKSLPGSLELTTHLLETLNKVVQSLPAAHADVIYVQQLLMSAIETTSSKIKVCTCPYLLDIEVLTYVKEVPNISPSVIRIDVLVEVIRSMIPLLSPLTLFDTRCSIQKPTDFPSGTAPDR
jgi:U3 small nucleolar RNA-associated protein 10